MKLGYARVANSPHETNYYGAISSFYLRGFGNM